MTAINWNKHNQKRRIQREERISREEASRDRAVRRWRNARAVPGGWSILCLRLVMNIPKGEVAARKFVCSIREQSHLTAAQWKWANSLSVQYLGQPLPDPTPSSTH